MFKDNVIDFNEARKRLNEKKTQEKNLKGLYHFVVDWDEEHILWLMDILLKDSEYL